MELSAAIKILEGLFIIRYGIKKISISSAIEVSFQTNKGKELLTINLPYYKQVM